MRRPFLTAALALLLPLGACNRAGAQAVAPAELAAETQKSDAFLAANAKKPGVVVLPSGLQYRVIKAGPVAGPHPAEGDEIKVHYEGKLIDGKVFDSSFERGTPAIMTLARLVPGWMEAIPLMRAGDEWELVLPASLGYGDRGAGEDIPPGATLVFKLQLLGVLPASRTGLG